MNVLLKYPDRVSEGKDGAYRWSVEVERLSRENKVRNVTMGTCGGLSLFLIGFMAILGDAFATRVTSLSCLAVMFIAEMACKLEGRSNKYTTKCYELDERGISILSGKDTYNINFDDINEIIVNDVYLELKGPKGGQTIYVPSEDYTFVSRFILRCVPVNTKVEYK